MISNVNETHKAVIADNQLVSSTKENVSEKIFNIKKTQEYKKKPMIFLINKKPRRPIKNTKANQLTYRKRKINEYLQEIKSTIQHTFANHNVLDLTYIKVFTQLMIEQHHPIDFFPCSSYEDMECNDELNIKENEKQKTEDNKIVTKLFKRNSCNCQKSNCKMNYCECRRNIEYCDLKCNCLDCSNNKKN